jgi:hypothetical protein
MPIVLKPSRTPVALGGLVRGVEAQEGVKKKSRRSSFGVAQSPKPFYSGTIS